MMSGANPSICFYVLGNMMAKIIDQFGTAAQKTRYVQADARSATGARRWC